MAEKKIEVKFATETQIAWLIEWPERSTPAFWCGELVFTTDANAAIRFARRIDAQKLIATFTLPMREEVAASEHVFYDVKVVRRDDAASVRPRAVDSRIVAPASRAAELNSTPGR
jgi:hypothetical protein